MQQYYNQEVDDLRKFVDYPVEKFLVVGEHEKASSCAENLVR